MKIELSPFRVPNFVFGIREPGRREDGLSDNGLKWTLKEVEAEERPLSFVRSRRAKRTKAAQT